MLLLYSIEGEIKQRMLPVALRGSMDRLCAELEAVRPAVILPTPTLKPLISATGPAALPELFRQRQEDAIRSFGPRGRDGRCPPAKRSSPTSASICFSRLGGSQRGGMVVNRPARASGIDAVGLHAGGMDFLLPSRGVAHELGTSGNDN